MQIIEAAGGRYIGVESLEDGAHVVLRCEAAPMETHDDHDFVRNLLPDEALELAAALRHHAREQRRRWKA